MRYEPKEIQPKGGGCEENCLDGRPDGLHISRFGIGLFEIVPKQNAHWQSPFVSLGRTPIHCPDRRFDRFVEAVTRPTRYLRPGDITCGIKIDQDLDGRGHAVEICRWRVFGLDPAKGDRRNEAFRLRRSRQRRLVDIRWSRFDRFAFLGLVYRVCEGHGR